MNTYAYVNGNPVMGMDPLGLDDVLIFKTEATSGAWSHAGNYAEKTERNKCDTPCEDGFYQYNVKRVSQINKKLIEHENIRAVYIIGHSSPEAIFVGQNSGADSNINTPNQLNWSNLTKRAQIYIWGCNAGAGKNSISEQISRATGKTTHAFSDYINFRFWGKPFVRFFRDGGPVTFTSSSTEKEN